jgi:hypothetical protein
MCMGLGFFVTCAPRGRRAHPVWDAPTYYYRYKNSPISIPIFFLQFYKSQNNDDCFFMDAVGFCFGTKLTKILNLHI